MPWATGDSKPLGTSTKDPHKEDLGAAVVYMCLLRLLQS